MGAAPDVYGHADRFRRGGADRSRRPRGARHRAVGRDVGYRPHHFGQRAAGHSGGQDHHRAGAEGFRQARHGRDQGDRPRLHGLRGFSRGPPRLHGKAQAAFQGAITVAPKRPSMLTQIYEVSTPSEADAISGLGIDHVGVLVGNGAFPRERSAREAIAVIAAIRTPSKSSALFLSADIALIEQMARKLRPTIIHLGASTELLRPEHVIDLRKMLPNPLFMRSVPVTGSGSIAVARSYDGIPDVLLLDSNGEGDAQIGGRGCTHDWDISRRN